MKKIILFCLSLLPLWLFAQTTTPIAEVQENASFIGELVTVEGTVTADFQLFHTTRLKAYVQDASGKGIRIYDGSLTDEEQQSYETLFQKGKVLRVTGRVAQLTSSSEDQITVIEDGDNDELLVEELAPVAQLPEPLLLTIAEALDVANYEGTRIQVSGIVSSIDVGSTVKKMWVKNADGDSIPVWIYEPTGISIDALVDGQGIQVTGILSYFREPIILPVTQEDIQAEEIPFDFSMSKHIFAPDLGESITFNFFIPQEARVIIRIYDVEGKLMRTLADGIYTKEENIVWDGTNDVRQNLLPGFYVCHIEATETDIAQKHVKQLPVVIAAPLK